MTIALIIVDMQKDFCPGGALAVPGGDEVVPLINKMIDCAQENDWLVFATFDSHPRDTKHFETHGGKWPEHCLIGTEGAELHSGLNVFSVEKLVFVKKGDSGEDDGYSGFEGHTDNGRDMLSILKEYGISLLFICGLATDYCVKATALDAVRHGFVTHLLVDACRAVNLNPNDGANAIEEMTRAGVMLTDVERIAGRT